MWVDANRACGDQIKKNLARTNLTGGVIYTSDVFSALKRLDKRGEQFDFIFLDPPYDQGLVEKTLACLAELSLLKEDGIIIAEASKKRKHP